MLYFGQTDEGEKDMNLSLKLVVFCVKTGKLKFFLPGRILPSGEIEGKESLDEAAKRTFSEWLRIELDGGYIEQLYTFSEAKGNIVVAYYVLLPSEISDKTKNEDWKARKDIRENVGDKAVVSYAIQRLRWKIEYTNVVYALLPAKFTLSELQNIYEAILDKKLDKRNFRKKMLSLKLLVSTGQKKSSIPARPAEMFKFKTRKPEIVKIFS
jgi:8-oxo-dGTP diphosphatase